MTSRQQELKIRGSRDLVSRIVAVANQLDLNNDGLYDARAGCVNIWCSPTDKPTCWPDTIIAGDLKYRRDFVGSLYWDWLDDDSAKFYIDCSPYSLLRNLLRNVDWSRHDLTDDIWGELFKWLKEKVDALISLAESRPSIIGLRCPRCDFVLPAGHLLNDLVVHMRDRHNIITNNVTLNRRIVFDTDAGVFAVEQVEVFK